MCHGLGVYVTPQFCTSFESHCDANAISPAERHALKISGLMQKIMRFVHSGMNRVQY